MDEFIKRFESLPESERHKVLLHLKKILVYRGHLDYGGLGVVTVAGECEQAAKVFADNGHEILEYT